MATTNLNLGTIASSDQLSSFVNLFNGNMTTLDKSFIQPNGVAYSAIDGITQNGLYIITGSNIGVLIHKNYDATAAEQIFKPLSGRQFLFRTKLNGTWGVWHNPSGDLLWMNESPSASFESQTITCDLSAYRFVKIQCFSKASYLSMFTKEFGKNTAIMIDHVFRGNPFAFCCREGQISESGIAFYTAYKSVGGTTSPADDYCIPYAIYGIV